MRLKNGKGPFTSWKLTYPIAIVNDYHLHLERNFFGVKIYDRLSITNVTKDWDNSYQRNSNHLMIFSIFTKDILDRINMYSQEGPQLEVLLTNIKHIEVGICAHGWLTLT